MVLPLIGAERSPQARRSPGRCAVGNSPADRPFHRRTVLARTSLVLVLTSLTLAFPAPAWGAVLLSAVQESTRQASPERRQQAATPSSERPGTDREELSRRLLTLIDDPALERSHVGLMVQVAETGEVLFTHAAEKLFVAASTAKLVIAAVAIQRLGSDYRWRTRLLAAGPIRSDTLIGDLWVVGGGDPRLTARELERWPQLLRTAGIRHIEGDAVGDDRAFTGPIWGRGWTWEDVYAGWGTGVSGLQLSPGRIRAELIPGPEVGSAALLRILDAGSPSPVVSRVRTGPPASELRIHFEPSFDGGPVHLEGWMPAGMEPVSLTLAPMHPTTFLLDHLRAALSAGGISVAGQIRRAEEEEHPATETWSRNLPSETLEEVVGDFLKHSDNQVGETLLRTLGLELGGIGSAEEGLEVVEETLAGWAIEPASVNLADGSGLSRYTQLTPAALTRLLRRIWQLPGFDVLRQALPLAARDGTLAGRLEATAAEGNVQAKTGSLAGVRALAGYVTDADGETLVFSLLLNGYGAPGDVAAALEDLLVEQLALYHGADYRREASQPPPDRRR